MHRPLVTAAISALTFLAGPTLQAAEPAAMDDAARMNYALGYQLGRDLVATEFKSEALLKGIEDARKGAPPQLNAEQMAAALKELEQRISEQRAKEQAAVQQRAAAAGKAYLAENALAAGVKTTASGLQYRVVKEGTGRTPAVGDSVTVHYRGTLVDGTEFDSSRKRGEPATFKVGEVIAGWTEALQMMKEGAQWQLAIPPNLAYSDRGPLAGQVLVFDVELISVTPGGAKTP